VVATVGLVGRLDSDFEEDEGEAQGNDGGEHGDGGGQPGKPSRRDAGVAEDAGMAGWTDGGVVGNCVILLDQSVTWAPTSANSGVVAGTTVQGAMCTVADATGDAASSIWSRKDGVLLMEAGEEYSFRWPAAISLLTALKLFGGAEQCSSDKVHEQLAPVPGPYLPSPGCADIKADFDVTYLRMAHLYGQWDLGTGFRAPMQLCKEPCPPAM
jgi:hypothetical protein